MNLGEILLTIIVALLASILVVMIFHSNRTQSWDEIGVRLKSMRKSTVDSKIAGVCAGFGVHTPIPAWIWRVIFLLLLFCGGIGLLAYIILAICMPSAPDGVA